MKGFNKLSVIAAVIIALTIAFANIICITSQNSKDNEGRPYRVEIYRSINEISKNGYENINFKNYSYITNIEKLDKKNELSFYSGNNSDYMIMNIDGELYRFDYSYKENITNILLLLNISLGVITVTVIGLMLFVRQKIIHPFEILKDVPYELSKGNLSVPLKENKNKYFGKFVWGLDLLRERLEKQKNDELKLQKDKKMLLLSISHDIKTPLGIIELYAKSLQKNLYKDKKKQEEIAINISKKCNEINNYVSDIIKASREDFLHIEVNLGEFYLSEMMNTINTFYKEKTDFMKVRFSVQKYSDCILKGDIDRSVEVLQNIIENALKYGDGKKISIIFEREEDCVLITVSNSGCTLDENEFPHIFDSFWRGSNVGSNQGSGLGLYICRQIMSKSDGDIIAQLKDGYMNVTVVFRTA